MSAVLPLKVTAAMSIVRTLLDIRDKDKQCRNKAEYLKRHILVHSSNVLLLEAILQHFTEYYAGSLTCEMLEFLIPQHLKTLNLTKCHNILQNEEDYVALLPRMANIRHLIHDEGLDMTPIPDGIADHWSSQLPHLTSVSVKDCPGVTSSFVRTVLFTVPHLKHLNVSGCSNITDRAFLNTANSPPPNLVSLDISGCRTLTNTSVRLVTELCGLSLRHLNVAATNMDCTILWYLAGHSLASSVQLASQMRGRLSKMSDATSTQMDRLLHEFQFISQKLEEMKKKEQEGDNGRESKTDKASGENKDVQNEGDGHTCRAEVLIDNRISPVGQIQTEKESADWSVGTSSDKLVTGKRTCPQHGEAAGGDGKPDINAMNEYYEKNRDFFEAQDDRADCSVPTRNEEELAPTSNLQSSSPTGSGIIKRFCALESNPCSTDDTENNLSMNKQKGICVPPLHVLPLQSACTGDGNSHASGESMDETVACVAVRGSVSNSRQSLCEENVEVDVYQHDGDNTVDDDENKLSGSLNESNKPTMFKTIEGSDSSSVGSKATPLESNAGRTRPQASRDDGSSSSSSLPIELNLVGEEINSKDKPDISCNQCLHNSNFAHVATKLFQPHLLSLNISFIQLDTDLVQMCFVEFFSANPCLRRLSLGNRSIVDEQLWAVADNCCDLNYLSLTNCTKVSDDGIAYVLERCRKLRHLILRGLQFLTNGAFLPLVVGEESVLRVLHIPEVKITDHFLKQLTHSIGHTLSEIDLSWCDDITPAGIRDLVNNCPSLELISFRLLKVGEDVLCRLPNYRSMKNMDLSGMELLTDTLVINMMPHLRNLQVLDISWIWKLTDAAVMTILACCPLLLDINLTGLSLITTKPFLPIIKDINRWLRCKAFIKLKLQEQQLAKRTGEAQLSSDDEEYEVIYVPVRSTSYAPLLQKLNLQYCDLQKDPDLAEIVAICCGSLEITNYYGDKVCPKILTL